MSSFASWILKIFLEWITPKIVRFIDLFLKEKKQKSKDVKSIAEAIDKLKKAKTKEERDAAAEDIINNF